MVNVHDKMTRIITNLTTTAIIDQLQQITEKRCYHVIQVKIDPLMQAAKTGPKKAHI